MEKKLNAQCEVPPVGSRGPLGIPTRRRYARRETDRDSLDGQTILLFPSLSSQLRSDVSSNQNHDIEGV